ncbi:hypothetical protein MW290_09445 [Aquincola tertiaricarbonis]|uniref:Transmembrane protein n=1 Tax=Aquincola tertiaricarbonis TaxID=391953 RepID=A0ABY4RZ49_AQUTE|nr:hypothetical protein [Aquincola tertiaricarbonis]URI06151.1 hypothetical protein MW290_09445 [Aquincola tertiaricarbonis]
MESGKQAVYGPVCAIPSWILYAAVSCAFLGAVVTIVVLYHYLPLCKPDHWQRRFYVCWCAWVLLPPLWFAFEYFVLFKTFGPDDGFESLKHGQQLAAQVWLGIAAVLTVIASK